MVLKRMKRRHTPEQAVAFCDLMRRLRPDTVFGADLIAGFPTETDAMFENTLQHVSDCGLTWLHVFPYSERPGTPAARMPAVEKPLRKERAQRLRQAGEQAVARFLADRVGTTARVLVEAQGRGRSEHFAPVTTPDALPAGSLADLAITSSNGTTLLTEAA
jgi:threonylcarbamoyladenosine tRNA methylthiotransferase MtaB